MATRPRSTIPRAFPQILTPTDLNLREVQEAVETTRERIEKLEAATSQVSSQAELDALKRRLDALRIQFAALVARVAALEELLGVGTAVPEFVTPEELAAAIAAIPPGSGAFVLYDNFGRAMLTGNGQEITVGP